jgi:hypothetical protein
MSRTAYGTMLMVFTGVALLYTLVSPARNTEARIGTCALLGAVFLVSFWAVVAEVAPGLFHRGAVWLWCGQPAGGQGGMYGLTK